MSSDGLAGWLCLWIAGITLNCHFLTAANGLFKAVRRCQVTHFLLSHSTLEFPHIDRCWPSRGGGPHFGWHEQRVMGICNFAYRIKRRKFLRNSTNESGRIVHISLLVLINAARSVKIAIAEFLYAAHLSE